MKNRILIKISKDILKTLLSRCTESERMVFNRMYSSDNLGATIDDVVDNIDPHKIDWAISQCENTLKKGNRPYLIDFDSFYVGFRTKYNSKYGDDRECECGHPYYRHFDTYEEMSPVGCKYCECYTFVEKVNEINK